MDEAEGHSVLAPVGSRIRAAVDGLAGCEGVSVEVSATGAAARYVVVAGRYRMGVLVDPAEWLGIDFELLDDIAQPLLSFWYDTDGYDIGLERWRWFVREIEDEIVEFLESLVFGGVYVGEVRGRPAMLVPMSGGFRRISGGPRSMKGEHFPDLASATAEGVWRRDLLR